MGVNSRYLDLIPSVKLGPYRRDDDNALEADEGFLNVRKEVNDRDGYVCQGCRMPTKHKPSAPSGFFEVHHLDDDHHNNQKENLKTVCPYCHSVFHIGNAAARQAIALIWLPQMSQAQLNLLCHVLFIMIYRGREKDKKDSRDDPDTELSQRMSRQAQEAYDLLRSGSFSEPINRFVGPGMSDPRQLAEALAWVGHRHPKLYAQRQQFLGGVRVLPLYEAYPLQIAHWARSSNYPELVLSASVLPSLLEQWTRIANGYK